MKQYLYYYNFHGSETPPSLTRVYLNWVIISRHVPGLKIWSLELSFKNAQIGFQYFFKPWAFPFKSKKLNIFKLGPLQGFTLRLGKPIVSVCLTNSSKTRQIEAIQKNALPADFYTVTETLNSKVEKCYELHLNYFFGENGRMIAKDYEHQSVQAYIGQPPTNQEIFRQILLNDWSRWVDRLYKYDKIEISESVYWHLLGCVPPRVMHGSYFEVGEPDDIENGKYLHRACIQEGDRFYTGYPDKLKPKA